MPWRDFTSLIELEKELKIKRRECRREYKCHFGAANNCRNKHNLFGILAIALGTIAGSGFLAKAILHFQYLEYFSSLFTLAAAFLTGLLTFNKYLEKAGLYAKAGRNWERMRDGYSKLLLKLYSVKDEIEVSKLLLGYDKLSEQRLTLREETVEYPEWLFKKHEHIKDKTELVENIHENN